MVNRLITFSFLGYDANLGFPIMETASLPPIASTTTNVLGYTSYTGWQMFWYGLPEFPQEHLLSVDQFGLWREHLAWSKKSGAELRSLVIQRLSSNTVLLTLLTSSMIGTLFSPSKPLDAVRTELKNHDYASLEFWTGIFLCITVFTTITALYTNFTAWSIFSVISDENVHCFLRSTIGLYASQLPMRVVSMVIFFFLVTMDMFLFLLMPFPWATGITIIFWLLLIHLTSTYSALGRIIVGTGAMGSRKVFESSDADMMEPYELYVELLKRCGTSKGMEIPIKLQYHMTESLRRATRDLEAGLSWEAKEEDGSKEM